MGVGGLDGRYGLDGRGLSEFPFSNPLISSLREHIDLINSIGFSTINSIYLAGKLFHQQVPDLVTRLSFAVINTLGILYLDFQVSFTLKTAKDCLMAWQVHAWKILVLTAMATINAVSDLFLTLGGCIASLATLVKYPHVTEALYSVMRPWGVTFLFVAIGLDIGNYLIRQTVTTSIKEVKSAQKAQTIFSALRNDRSLRGPEARLAAGIRCCMDKYSLRILLEKLDQAPKLSSRSSLQLLKDVEKNLESGLLVGENYLILRAIGYISLFISKAYPYSLAQAASLCTVSWLYTLNLAYKKILEARYQAKMKKDFFP